MSPEQFIFNTLKDLLPQRRVFPEHLPESTPLPCCVYNRSGGRLNLTVCRGGNDAAFRVVLYAKTASEREKLMQSVIDALEAEFEQTAAPFLAFDFNLKAHTAVLAYSLPESFQAA